jgi:hypothetical protein
LTSKLVHLAAVFVVVLCIAPDEADLFFERIPGFEVGDSSMFVASMLAVDALAYLFERDGILDVSVVIFELSRRQIREWCEYF